MQQHRRGALPHNNKPSARREQRGMALVFVLIMMTVIFVIGVASARISLFGERAARNDRDYQTAFQSAEAALADAEIDIMGPNNAVASRVSSFSAGAQAGSVPFDPGCSSVATRRGLCGGGSIDAPLYKSVDFEATGSSRQYATYGDFTGRSFAVASGGLPAALPKYIIEDTDLYFSNVGRVRGGYVITAVGYGLSASTRVAVQAVISKPKPTE